MGTNGGLRMGSDRFDGQLIHVLLKMVRYGGSFRIDAWIEIYWCGRMGLVVLNVPGDDLERGSN